MSRQNSDDFFGIEYESPSYSRSSDEPIEHTIKKESSRYVPPVSYCSDQKELQRLSGTEYIDEAFFPGVKELHEEVDVRSPHHEFYSKMTNYGQNGSREENNGGDLDFHKSSSSQNKRLHRIQQEDFDNDQKTTSEGFQDGLNDMRSSLLPVWHMKDDELIEMMCSRLIHADDKMIAFDKPYGLAYSGGPSNRPQFDRILQHVKMRIAPRVERLHLVKSLDKNQSGVIIFATSKLIQDELKEAMSSSLITNRHRCIVRGKFGDKDFSVNIPLVKKLENKNMKMMPLLSNKTKDPIFYVESTVKVNSTNEYASYVDVITTNEVSYQTRCHLHLAGCPLIGDEKYGGFNGRPPKLSDRLYSLLNLTENQARRIPMYAHLQEVSITRPLGERVTIHARIPDHFKWMLKRLRLLRK